jgi:hypothetical protein
MNNPFRRTEVKVFKSAQGNGREVTVETWRWEVLVPVATVATIVLLVLLVAGLKAFSRYQARADAANRARVTALNVRTANQNANVRAAEADGIRRAQDIINRSLTPLYIQHEAVQAQLAMARSQNHTIIYVPAGTNGTPVITQDGKP